MSAQVMQILSQLCQGPELPIISYGGRYLGSIPWWYWDPIALEWWIRVLRAGSFMGGKRLYWSQSPGEWVPGWVPLSVTLSHMLRWFVQDLIRKGICDKECSVILAGFRRINSLVTPVGLFPTVQGVGIGPASVCSADYYSALSGAELYVLWCLIFPWKHASLLCCPPQAWPESPQPFFSSSLLSFLFSALQPWLHQPCLFTSYPPTNPL